MPQLVLYLVASRNRLKLPVLVWRFQIMERFLKAVESHYQAQVLICWWIQKSLDFISGQPLSSLEESHWEGLQWANALWPAYCAEAPRYSSIRIN